MKYIIVLLFCVVSQITIAQELVIDFGETKKGERWQVINDNVMGEFSEGQTWMLEDCVAFSGTISLKNKGGFSSFKSPFQNLDISKFTKVLIKYRSKAYAMAVTLEMDKRWFMPYYIGNLPPTNWKWKRIEIPFSEFERLSVGRKTSGTPTLEELAEIVRLGFVTNEKKAGDFKIEIDYIVFK